MRINRRKGLKSDWGKGAILECGQEKAPRQGDKQRSEKSA